MARRCRKENLVALVFSDKGIHSVQLSNDVSVKQYGILLDLRRGQYRFGGPTSELRSIGEKQQCELSNQYGSCIIGVYDRTNDEHLNNFICDTLRAQRWQSGDRRREVRAVKK